MALLDGDVVDGDVADGDGILLVGAEGVVDGGEVGGLGLGLDSCGEEELQTSATESYLRRGLVEQRESVPAPWSREGTWTAWRPCPCRRSLP